MTALDANGKYVVRPERIIVTPLHIALPPPIPMADRLDNENPRFPWDADVKAGKIVSVDCELLPGGALYGKEDSGEAEADEDRAGG